LALVAQAAAHTAQIEAASLSQAANLQRANRRFVAMCSVRITFAYL
jgi:hypothetical protein